MAAWAWVNCRYVMTCTPPKQASAPCWRNSPRDVLALNDLGYVLDLQERHAEAQICYQRAQQADPDRVATRVNLALSLALSGKAEQAEQMLRDVASSASATRKVRLDFAIAQVIAGHDQDAEQTLGADLSPAETKSAVEGIAELRPAKVRVN